MSDKTVDFIGEPDVTLVAEEVRQRVADLNRALEHAARMRIGVTLNAGFTQYVSPSAEVPLKIVLAVQALFLTKMI